MDPVPALAYELPDSSLLENGNTGIPGVTSFDSGMPGPHLVITALIHGNEVAGAVALVRLDALGLRPRRGRLTLILANLAAFRRFDPALPLGGRFLDEDMNRVWGPDLLASDGETYERRRARELIPVIARADALLDLHSMQHDGPPLLLCGTNHRSLALARRIGWPEWVIADTGHATGRRLLDQARFSGDEPTGPTALLLECGKHWSAQTPETAWMAILRFLAAFDMLDLRSVSKNGLDPAQFIPISQDESSNLPLQKIVSIFDTIIAESDNFTFPSDDLPSVSTLLRKGSLVGFDNGLTLRTPYDDCVLVMPARKARRGQTAARLGLILESPPRDLP